MTRHGVQTPGLIDLHPGMTFLIVEDVDGFWLCVFMGSDASVFNWQEVNGFSMLVFVGKHSSVVSYHGMSVIIVCEDLEYLFLHW